MSGHLSRGTIAIIVVSLANMCLLVVAAFYQRRGREGVESMLRVKLGYIAVSLGLCSQML